MRLLALLSLLFVLYMSSVSMAETIQIEGPNGPLSGELVVAENAHDIVVIIPGSGPIDGMETLHGWA